MKKQKKKEVFKEQKEESLQYVYHFKWNMLVKFWNHFAIKISYKILEMIFIVIALMREETKTSKKHSAFYEWFLYSYIFWKKISCFLTWIIWEFYLKEKDRKRQIEREERKGERQTDRKTQRKRECQND